MGKEPQPDIGIRISSPAPAVHRRKSKKWFSWLVPLFVLANLVIFVVTMYLNNCPETSSRGCFGEKQLGRFAFQPLKENPLLGPSSAILEKMGALDVAKVVYGHEAWRLVSCIWLHAGVVHVLANMLSLLFVGIRLEQEFGFLKFGLLYIISGFGGSLLSALFIKSSISVGASGALFGLLGGMLSEVMINWTIYANKCAALSALVLVIAINLAFGFLPHVDNFAHVGGFITGFLLGFILLMLPQFGWVSKSNLPPTLHPIPVKSKHTTYQYLLWTIAIICLIVWFAVGLTMLFRGVNANDHCTWCRYLRCVSTSKRSCSSSSSVMYCTSSQEGNYVSLTCDITRRTGSYLLPNASEDRIRELCTRLCS